MLKIFKNRIFIAIVLALIAMVLTYNLLISITDKVNIIVLDKEVQAFEVISESMLSYRLISRADKQELFPAAFENKSEIAGAIAKERIPANTVLQRSNMFIIDEEAKKMIGVDNKVNPKYLIPADLRLVGVNVDNEGSVGNMVNKNDIVDVVFTSKDKSTGGIYSKTILQQVTVFDVQADDESSSTKKTALLLVKPEQVSMLVAAKRNGSIDLLLNPNGSKAYTDLPFTVSSFAPPSVGNRTAMINKIQDDIIALPNLSVDMKNTLCLMLEKEKAFDPLYAAIMNSELPADKKSKLIEIITDN